MLKKNSFMGELSLKRPRVLAFCFGLSFLVLSLAANSVASIDLTIFGPKRYDRLKGKPTVYHDTFKRCSPSSATAVLRIQNGDAKATRIKAATVSVNGSEIVSENEFKQQVPSIEKTVSVQESNTLDVVLKSGMQDDPNNTNGKDPSFLIIELVGKDCDSTPPVISGPEPTDGAILNTATPRIAANYTDEANGSGIDISSVRLTVDGTNVTASSSVSPAGVSYTPSPPLAEGSHIVTLSVSDLARNTASLTWRFTTDTVSPLVTISSPVSGSTKTNTLPLNYSVSEGSAVVKVDNEIVSKTSGSTLGPLPDGPHTVRVESRDAAGNLGFAEVTFTVDTVAPTVTITSPSSITTRDGNPLLLYTVTEGTAVVRVDGIIVSKTSGNNLDLLADGPHTVRVEAMDAAGNAGFAEVNFVINSTVPLAFFGVSATTNTINTALSETGTIFYTINDHASVTFKIIPEKQGPTGTPVYQVSQTIQSAGPSSFTWDGRDSTGKVVPDEAYLYFLTATDGVATATYSPVIPAGTGTVSCSQGAGYDPYRNDTLMISYSVALPARVNLFVNLSGSIFKVMDSVPYASGNYTFDWNGRSSNGTILTGGTALAQCAVASLLRENVIITSGDTPKVTLLKTDPYDIQLSYGEFTRITYTLSRDANVTVTLLPTTGAAITFLNNQAQTAGAHEIKWDGVDPSDSSGKKLLISPEGGYTVSIQAVNPVTGASSVAKGSLRIWR